MRRAKFLGMLGLFCIALSAQGADIPGRLFFTPGQRASLDNARSAAQHAPAHSAQREADAEVILPGRELSLNGIIRSEGRTQLLINNEIRDARPGEVLHDGSARVANPRGRSIDIKVGQRLNPYSGKVENDHKKPPAAETPEPHETPR